MPSDQTTLDRCFVIVFPPRAKPTKQASRADPLSITFENVEITPVNSRGATLICSQIDLFVTADARLNSRSRYDMMGQTWERK